MKPKINTDRPQLTSEEILARRNFDGLLQQLPAASGQVIQKPFWKSGWFIGSFATVAVLAVGTWAYVSNKDAASQDAKNPLVQNPTVRQPDSNAPTGSFMKTSGAFIQPPLARLDIPFINRSLRVSQGGVLKFATGSQLKFPKNAFVDASGKAVSGQVDIRFREFHDAVDFFLSGIPMTYDSAGTKYQFESAGMVEVAAFQNGKVVYLKPGEKVEVELASPQTGKNYNVYRLDTAARNWIYLNKDNVKSPPDETVNPAGEEKNAAFEKIDLEQKAKEEQLQKQQQEAIKQVAVKNPLAEKPLEPRRSDKTKNRFTVKFNAHEFPEMATYRDVLFEVDETREAFDKNNYNITWDAVRLSKGERSDRYIISLTKGIKTVRLDVYPVFAGKSYDEAKKVFDEQMVQYNAALSSREQAEFAERKRFETLMSENLAEANEARKKLEKQMKDKMLNGSVAEKALHLFTISRFGVYNCDRAEQYPKGALVNAQIQNEDGDMLVCNSPIYLVDHQCNALFTYFRNPEASFQFNPKSRNLVWTVSNGVLYTLKETGFAALPSEGSCAMRLEAVTQQFNTAEEMRAYFGIVSPVQ
ncbi:MAG: hypothetical protein ACRCYO_04620 [Bacteroidia bacterium]